MKRAGSPRPDLFSPRLITGPLAGLAALLSALPVIAQTNGSWNVDASNNWSTASAWAGGTVASGAGMTATFANDITADRTVTLEATRTIGILQFGDVATGTAGSWIIAPPTSGAPELILDNNGGQPVIHVSTLGSGKLVALNTPLSTTAGFKKDGTGILRLGGANTSLQGTIDIARGRLILNNNNALGGATDINVNYDSAGATGGPGTALEIAGNVSTGNSATVRLTGGSTGDYRTSLIGNGNSVWAGNIVAGNGRPGLYAQNAAGFTFSGNLTLEEGTDPVVLFARGSGLGVISGTVDIQNDPFFKTDGGTWRLDSAGHQWSTTGVADGVLLMGLANALPGTAPLVIGQGSATIGRFDLNGHDQTVAGLRTDPASTAAAAQTIRNFSSTPATLTDLEPEGTLNIYKGAILPRVHLKKGGPGTLQLEGSFDHASTTLTDGPLILNTAGYLWHPVPLIVEAAGTLTKTGAGTARAASLTSAGGVRVQEGTLTLGTGTGSGSLSVTGFGSALGFGAGGGRLTTGTLDAGEFAGDSSSLRFEMDAGTMPYVTVTQAGGFRVNGSATVDITAANLTPGTWPLISYTGTIGGSGFAGLALGQTPHLDAVLEHDTANSRINLRINAMDSLIWTGVGSGSWEVDNPGLDNFKLASTGASSAFYPGDRVLFDDSAFVTNITTPGSGVLTGDLTFNNTTAAPYTISGILAGNGTLTKNNSGTLELSGANVFTGKAVINGGLLKALHASALGSSSTGTEINGGTGASPGGSLDVNGLNLGREPISVSGVGMDAAGTIVNQGAGQQNALRRVTLAGDTTFGGSGRWDIRSQNEGGDFLDLAGHTLTKTGANQISLVGIAVTPGSVVINQGILSVETTTTIRDAGSFLVNAEGTLGTWILGDGNMTRAVRLNGGLLNELGSGNTSVIEGPVSVEAPSRIGAVNSSTAASVLRLDGPLSGTEALEKISSGVVAFNGENTHSGPMTITEGTLRIGNGADTGTPGTGEIINNGTLDLRRSDTALDIPNAISGTGALTVNGAISSIVTLSGANSFTGNVTVNSGGIRITHASALGTGTKVLTLNNGTAGRPQLRLDGAGGDIVLDSAFSFQTSNNEPSIPVIVNEAGNNTIQGTFTLTAGGGGSYIRSDAGTLTLEGSIAPNTSGRILHLAGESHGILSGNLNNSGANTPALEKTGTGTWQITSTGSTYSGSTTVSSGRLVVDGIIPGANFVLNAAAVLAGGGTVAPGGFSTMGLNGTVAPGSVDSAGNSLPGVLTLGNAGGTTGVNLSDSSAFQYQLGAAGTPGTDYDHIGVRGTLALGDGLVDLNDFSFTTAPGFGAGTYILAQADTLTGSLGAVTTGTVGGRGAELSLVENTLVLAVGDLTAGGYSAWAAGKGLTGPNAGPAADFDSDGVSNLLEYAANSHPGQAASRPATGLSGQPWGMTFDRIPAHTDLTYELQVSDDLTAWQTIASGSSGNPVVLTVPGAATISETGASPVSVSIILQQVNARRYARLKVSLP